MSSDFGFWILEFGIRILDFRFLSAFGLADWIEGYLQYSL